MSLSLDVNRSTAFSPTLVCQAPQVTQQRRKEDLSLLLFKSPEFSSKRPIIKHNEVRFNPNRPRRRLRPHRRLPSWLRPHRLRILRHLLRQQLDLLHLRAQLIRRTRKVLLRQRRPRDLLRHGARANPRQQLWQLFPQRCPHLRRRFRHLLPVRPGRENLHGSHGRGHRVCQRGDQGLRWRVRLRRESSKRRVDCD